ncbi:hypothetical protein BKA67DRAFT_536730 [Truncatella angustata]|uniref:Uncharacterized protein n=1 Tax=Truncatella angustata TaxID=152316 RepID=A0A9P8ZXG0_9PEZI|nr:uncharacterized protein BKA67DRAFT_536730 [Truncatella angustata]KAH6653028.1 hypothetical protein BKA67DRAFT_536730 [Truncatella angustata]
MESSKYSPLSDGSQDRNIDDIDFRSAKASCLRQRAIIAILGVICFIQGLALLWLISGLTHASTQTFVFEDERPFSTAVTQGEVEKAWSIYGLPQSGFVHIQDPTSQGLRPNHGVIDGTENVYMISAMHQLHCLQELHISLSHKTAASFESSRSSRADAEVNHTLHCINYLRQAVLCSADDTLEGPDMHPEAGQSRLRGWGVSHQCRSWDKLTEFRDQHRVTVETHR